MLWIWVKTQIRFLGVGELKGCLMASRQTAGCRIPFKSIESFFKHVAVWIHRKFQKVVAIETRSVKEEADNRTAIVSV